MTSGLGEPISVGRGSASANPTVGTAVLAGSGPGSATSDSGAATSAGTGADSRGGVRGGAGAEPLPAACPVTAGKPYGGVSASEGCGPVGDEGPGSWSPRTSSSATSPSSFERSSPSPLAAAWSLRSTGPSGPPSAVATAGASDGETSPSRSLRDSAAAGDPVTSAGTGSETSPGDAATGGGTGSGWAGSEVAAGAGSAGWAASGSADR